MNYLDKLLDGVDVEWLQLGNDNFFKIANSGRKPVKASFRVAGKMPYYGANNIQDYVEGFTHNGEYVLIAEDGSKSLENYSIQYVEGKFWANNHIHVITGHDAVNTRYLYHCLCIVNFIPFLTGGGRAKLTKGEMIKISIPIPCPDNPKKSLAIQAEIVKILDSELTAELTAELGMRKKQYQYYRDQLLTFDLPAGQAGEGEVEWKALGDIGEFVRGNGLPKADFTESGIPAIHYGQIYKYYGLATTSTISHVSPETASKLKKVNTGDVIITNTSENFEDVGKALVYLGAQQAVTGGHATIFKPSNLILGKYFAYFTQTSTFTDQKRKYAKGAKVIDVSAKDMMKITIPLPPLSEQTRIVSILDKFDSLTNSITEGLPREIKLRQQQYAYYRDLLLDFPKSKEVAV